MNHLVKFNEANFLKDTYIHYLCKKYKIKNYIIDKNGFVNVGEVNLSEFRFNELPIKFGRVTGNFYCRCSKLTSLVNSPRRIDGNFNVSFNNLTSLEGFPEYVGKDVNLLNNPIRSVKGFPEFFECSNTATLIISKDAPIFEIFSIFDKDVQDENSKIYFNDFKDSIRIFKMLNEYDVIQGGNIVSDRLEMALDQLGIEIPNNLDLKNYKLI